MLYLRLKSPDELSHDNELEENCILRERHLHRNGPSIQQNYGREPTCIYQNEDIAEGSRFQRIPHFQLQSNLGPIGIYNSDYITPRSHLQNIPNLQLQPNSGLERISRSEDLTQRCCSEHTPTLQMNYDVERIPGKDGIIRGNNLHNIPNRFLYPQPTYGQEDCIPGGHLQNIPRLQQRQNCGLGTFSNSEDLLPMRYLQNIQDELQGNYDLDRIYTKETRTAPSRFPLTSYNPRESYNGNIHLFTTNTFWRNPSE